MAESENQGPKVTPGAPPECRQFDFLVGEWDVAATRLKADGSVLAQYRASWSAKLLNEGHMVVDNFEALDPTGRVISSYVTLRTYSVATGRWEMVGLAALQPAANASWHGEWKDDEMRLYASGKDPAGAEVRTMMRFFGITKSAFMWESSSSGDGGQTWVKTASLLASRVS